MVGESRLQMLWSSLELKKKMLTRHSLFDKHSISVTSSTSF